MITRQEYNEQVRKAGRERMKSRRDRYYHSGSGFYDRYGGLRRQISDEQREAIRLAHKARSRKSRRWTLFFFALAAILFGFLGYIILLSLY